MMILLHHMVQNIDIILIHFTKLFVALTLLVIFSFLSLLKSRGCANNFFLCGGSCGAFQKSIQKNRNWSVEF